MIDFIIDFLTNNKIETAITIIIGLTTIIGFIFSEIFSEKFKLIFNRFLQCIFYFMLLFIPYGIICYLLNRKEKKIKKAVELFYKKIINKYVFTDIFYDDKYFFEEQVGEILKKLLNIKIIECSKTQYYDLYNIKFYNELSNNPFCGNNKVDFDEHFNREKVGIPKLFVCNKEDVKGALMEEEVQERLLYYFKKQLKLRFIIVL